MNTNASLGAIPKHSNTGPRTFKSKNDIETSDNQSEDSIEQKCQQLSQSESTSLADKLKKSFQKCVVDEGMSMVEMAKGSFFLNSKQKAEMEVIKKAQKGADQKKKELEAKKKAEEEALRKRAAAEEEKRRKDEIAAKEKAELEAKRIAEEKEREEARLKAAEAEAKRQAELEGKAKSAKYFEHFT